MKLAVWLNVSIKIILLIAVLYMFLFPDQSQFESKSLTLRAICYPIFAFFLLGIAWIKKYTGHFPSLFDFLWSFTFTFDIVGNDLGLYNAFAPFDDMVHFINAIPFTFIIFTILTALEQLKIIRLSFWCKALFTLAIHASLHNLWEIWEYGMDRFAGTVLQPGGMTEATENNLAGIAGSFVAVFFLYWLRNTPVLERFLFSPVKDFLRFLLKKK